MSHGFENASESTKRRNPHLFGSAGLPSAGQQCGERDALGHIPEGKTAGGTRFEISFTVYAVRPNDYDNLRCKELQDCLVKAGLIPDDNWRVLQGRIISKKASSQAEERTEILIEQIT